MAKKKNTHYSGIGGQAVLEGVMMRNKERYAVAVRKPDGEIAVELETHKGSAGTNKLKEIPFIRGMFQFVDSMLLGMKALNFSASFYDEEEAADAGKSSKEGSDKLMNTLVVLVAIAMAVGLFIVLPYVISAFFEKYIRNASLLAVMEGGIRIAIFLLYVWGISFMKDIKRLYRYHGAEHKCINCVEKGRPLTVKDVMRSSRLHRRCGTSFIFFVLIVSIILFFFIRVDNLLLKVALRILLMPLVAGISFELIRLAGRSDNILVRILSAPGMLIQRLTTGEPDEEMVEVAIAAVEAVFDWKAYLKETFGYEVDDSWLDDTPKQEDIDEDDIETDDIATGDIETDDIATDDFTTEEVGTEA